MLNNGNGIPEKSLEDGGLASFSGRSILRGFPGWTSFKNVLQVPKPAFFKQFAFLGRVSVRYF